MLEFASRIVIASTKPNASILPFHWTFNRMPNLRKDAQHLFRRSFTKLNPTNVYASEAAPNLSLPLPSPSSVFLYVSSVSLCFHLFTTAISNRFKTTAR